jgi:tetratricopeptide (TPR) repeat protein
MSSDSLHLEHDLILSFQDRIDILFHEIELAVRWDRPSIIFAIYKSEIIRDEVNRLLAEKLANISQKTNSINTNSKNKFDFLSQISQLPDLFRTVLLIDGFNWKCGTNGVHILNEFNNHREYFIDNNIRAIFWLFENEVSDFAANATECWILRHRVVEFVDVPQQDQGLIQPLESCCQAADNPPRDEDISYKSAENELNTRDNKKGNTIHAKALLSLGILFWRKGNLRRAHKYLLESAKISKLLTNSPLQAQCHNALALVHTELGNTDEAVSSYQQAISLSPDSGFLWNNLGQLLAKNERNNEAIVAFKKALLCSPQDFLSWDGVGHIFLKLGVFQNAISAFEKAIEIAPYYEFSWAGIGKAYLESGQLEKAEDSLRKAVELSVHMVDAWINLGKCFAQQERDLDAIAVYHRAIEFNPQKAEIWVELGSQYLNRQNYTESISAFQNAILISSDYGEAYIRLAFALFQIGDYESSALAYKDGIPLFDDDLIRAGLLNRLGDTYLQMKDYEKAIAVYEQSDRLQNEHKEIGDKKTELIEEISGVEVNRDPEYEHDDFEKERGEKMNEANHVFDMKTAVEWNEHGNSHLKAGSYNDAIVAYTKAIELAPEASWPYIQNLAHVHYQKGKARGKQNAGKIEDPDIWEGEDESESDPFFGCITLSNLEGSDSEEEPTLEKANRHFPKSQPIASTDTGLEDSNNAAPEGNGMNQVDETVIKIVEEDSNLTEINKDSNVQAFQTAEAPGSVPSKNSIKPQHDENTPQNSIDWNELGNSYTSSKKLDDAIAAYKKAIEMNPKFGQPYRNLGIIYYRLGKYEVAIQLYKKSIDLLEAKEDKGISWNRLGDAYRRLGDYGNALAAYQKASEMAPIANPVMVRARATLLENFVAG